MRQHRWVLKQIEDVAGVESLGRDLNDLPIELARALTLRGITTRSAAQEFFRASLENLHDPFLMRGMDAAVGRISAAISGGEKIYVYGDYDVDGTTSTALLTSFLRSLSCEVSFFVPNRHIHGYGLSEAGIDICIEKGAQLIIAVDCGISSVSEIAWASGKGVDVIVCDHHMPLDELPDAVAILNPKQPECAYPYKELCGCGVTFKFVQAILAHLKRDPRDADVYLDLVALGTASDIVSVTGENRILLREGLIRMRTAPRRGLRYLAMEARVKLPECSAVSILFSLGPRINAAGRLGEASRAVNLFLAETDQEAAALAQELELINTQRREIDRETQKSAIKQAELRLTSSDLQTLVLYNPEWNVGVIGIVASRLVDRFYRPTVLLTLVNGVVKGSARSVNGVSIFEAIRDCEDLLLDFGGHEFAAGVTLLEENVQPFCDRFESAVSSRMKPELLDPILEVDTEMDLTNLTDRFWSVLKQFAPFGPDNTEPTFLARDLLLAGRPRTVGREQSHLKFSVTPRDKYAPEREVIGFGLGSKLDLLESSRDSGEPVDLLFSIQENTWGGRTSIQLRAHDVRFSTGNIP